VIILTEREPPERGMLSAKLYSRHLIRELYSCFICIVIHAVAYSAVSQTK